MVGQTISHYRVVARLGEGGMGEVYRAEDTSLGRPVALKFLAGHLLNDAEAKQRFFREAKAAAVIRHPNICTVFEVAEEGGKTFLAMDYVEGESLEERIAKGPLPLKDALEVGRQIAEGLEAAHEKGIVHRDIKPANVMVEAKGHATILDFGLARLTEASKLTKPDQTVGTVAYMSPEQIQGGEVDHRSDIWALGCTLYEMIAGVRPFQGQYDQALAYEICNQEPEPLTGIRAGVPMELEFIVGKCLAKDAADRYQAAKEIAVDLRTLAEKLKSGRSTILRSTVEMPGASGAVAPAGQTQNLAAKLPPETLIVRGRSQRALQGVALALGVALLSILGIHFSEVSPQKRLRRFTLVPPPNIDFGSTTAGPVISPDGEHIAFTTIGVDGLLWVQDLDQEEPRALAGTAGARLPFWSPDSRFIGYAAGEQLRKISVEGGASGLLCRLATASYFQGSWSPDGNSIVFSVLDGVAISLYEVSSQGGDPTVLVAEADLGGAKGFLSRPHFLPPESGRALLFTLGGATQSTLYAKNLDTGQLEELGPGDRPAYSPSTGLLVYQSQRNVFDLWARPFSPETLQFTGSAFSVRERARTPSLSEDGTLTYLDGSSTPHIGLFWTDRTGRLESESFVDTALSANPTPALSPDGRSVVYSRSGAAMWVENLSRGSRVRLTKLDELNAPGSGGIWSPEGEKVAFSVADAGGSRAVVRAADGSGETITLFDGSAASYVSDWTTDGRVVLTIVTPETGHDLWYRESAPDGFGEPRPFLQTQSNEMWAKVSPNGRYIAYVSDESGQPEVYVQPFPEGGRRTAISTAGGAEPRWSPDGEELFYAEGVTLVSVSVSTDGDFLVGAATRLFQYLTSTTMWPNYDVSPDGERFIVNAGSLTNKDGEIPKIRIVENWYEEFRDRED